jgi:PAS domain-containing protein
VARLFYDVADQHRLAAEQGRFRAVLDEASDAIRIIDCDSQRIVDVNRADCALSGYSREDLVGATAASSGRTTPSSAGGRSSSSPKPTPPDIRRRRARSSAIGRGR